ncbi:hypothetical protein EMIHUDRAFT_256358 [Emiliania huxleyi CCMP1516]|uniref:Uncharacterized protein n=2 Tax=Emiliania huxleyi TaxID=2903 RepID=A0A0D3IWX1_EMIH1|nr:hypothetical protein EMIHUDRAFT_256358 [Emiliania huxleyi CCMP1516]EOD15756.1 hypothetical protein EMIHUDRAFT_256358 [Emiliania huxleyi CCMP1516]|eukprot:XP_005768185.1 hypothetical protein EMIHUDRAFT_256358 [Emiliania huxleyi CCMP1516]
MRRALHLPVLPWPSVCPPNGWQVPLLLWGMPHGCDWPAPRRVSSARRSDRGQRNSPGLNAQPGAPARAGARHGACNAQQCSPRLAQMRPSSQPTVHRLLKKHSDECGTGDAWQAALHRFSWTAIEYSMVHFEGAVSTAQDLS